jgi:hypothetical protein
LEGCVFVLSELSFFGVHILAVGRPKVYGLGVVNGEDGKLQKFAG